MSKTERNEAVVLEMLERRHIVGLTEAIQTLGVSESTARRIFAEIESKGKAVRTHGGLRKVPEYSFDITEKEYAPQKTDIGRRAALLVNSGDTVFIDSGSTARCLSEALAERLRKKELHGVSVVTVSHINAELLGDCANVWLPCGTYRPGRRDVAGSECVRQLETLRFTAFFAGTDGIDKKRGLMTTDPETKNISATVLRNSDKVYVLADSSKFGKTSLMSFCPDLSAVTAVITDSCPDKEYSNKFDIIKAGNE